MDQLHVSNIYFHMWSFKFPFNFDLMQSHQSELRNVNAAKWRFTLITENFCNILLIFVNDYVSFSCYVQKKSDDFTEKFTVTLIIWSIFFHFFSFLQFSNLYFQKYCKILALKLIFEINDKMSEFRLRLWKTIYGDRDLYKSGLKSATNGS